MSFIFAPQELPCYHSPDDLIRSEEHTSELQSLRHLVCRLLLEKKKNKKKKQSIRNLGNQRLTEKRKRTDTLPKGTQHTTSNMGKTEEMWVMTTSRDLVTADTD